MTKRMALLVVAVAVAVAAASGQQSDKTIEAEMFPIPPATHSGSGYTAVECGLDGKIYVGTAHYGGSAHLVRFDPKTKQWDDLIDAHKVTREKGTGLDSQSKFHAKILVDADGTVWAATKQGNEEFTNRPEYGENPTGFPGGHLFSYNPKTGAVRDHGILKKQEGVMGGAIDRARRRLYYWSDPKQHFLIYDIAANTVRDLGSIGGSPRYMAIDGKGRVFTPGRKGVMCMYDPQKDELYDLAVKLEGAGTYQDPYAIVTSADGKAIFGAAIGGESVMEFDLNSIGRKGKEGEGGGITPHGTIVCRHVARSIPEPHKPSDQHAATLGKDGCFYFPNVSNNSTHLIRYDPKKKQVEDLGVITIKGKPDIKPTAAQGACVGLDGTLYLKFISYQTTPYCIVAFEKLTAR
jgi:hypothetical protein